MARRHAALGVALISLLALAAPAPAGQASPLCDNFREAIQEATKVVDKARPPARTAARKLKSAARALTNAEGKQAKRKARAKVRRAKRKRNRTRAKLRNAESNLLRAQRRYDAQGCGEGGGGYQAAAY